MSTMRKISRIMYIIANVMLIISIISFAINGILNVVYGIIILAGGKLGLPFYYRYLLELLYEYFPEVVDYIYYYVGASLIASGATLLLMIPLYIVALVFVVKAKKEDATFVTHLVAGILGYLTNTFALVGGILGCIAVKKEARRNAKKPEPKVVDVMSEDIEEVK